MAKTYQDGLVRGYKMGVKEGKQEALVELQKNILQIQERSANIDAFLNKVHQYTDIQELDAEIIRTFIS